MKISFCCLLHFLLTEKLVHQIYNSAKSRYINCWWKERLKTRAYCTDCRLSWSKISIFCKKKKKKRNLIWIYCLQNWATLILVFIKNSTIKKKLHCFWVIEFQSLASFFFFFFFFFFFGLVNSLKLQFCLVNILVVGVGND